MHARLKLPRWPAAPRRAFCAAVACSIALCLVAAAGAADWLEFRGPLGRAIAASLALLVAAAAYHLLAKPR